MRSKALFVAPVLRGDFRGDGGALVARQGTGRSTESKGTPEAKALLAQAEAKMRGAPDYDAGILLLKQAIQADPHFAEAYERLYSATHSAATVKANQTQAKTGDAHRRRDERSEEAVRGVGRGRSEERDSRVGARLARREGLGEGRRRTTTARSRSIRTSRGPTCSSRSSRTSAATTRQQVDYLKKAADVDPADPQYFFYWASAMKSVDPARSIVLLQQVADKYPGTERGAQGLYWAAFETSDLAKKIAIYERLRREFPPAKSGWSESGMSGLLEAYERADPGKAVALAEGLAAEMTSPSDKKTWGDFAAYARAVVDAQASIDAGRGADAIALVDKAPRPRYINTTALDLLRASAQDANGATAAAYDGGRGGFAVAGASVINRLRRQGDVPECAPLALIRGRARGPDRRFRGGWEGGSRAAACRGGPPGGHRLSARPVGRPDPTPRLGRNVRDAAVAAIECAQVRAWFSLLVFPPVGGRTTACLFDAAFFRQDGGAAGGWPPSGGGGVGSHDCGPDGPVESWIAPRPSRDPNGNPSARLA